MYNSLVALPLDVLFIMTCFVCFVAEYLHFIMC
jgi:hypothetical protein